MSLKSRLPSSILYSLLVAFLTVTPGCIRYGATLNLSSTQRDQTYTADFSRAFITRDDAGDYQIVLLNDPIDQVKPGDGDKPIDPSAVNPLRQIMTIRVLWRPMKGAKFDHPLATNAALHWYVFDRTAQSPGFLHYAGNAFVNVYTEQDRASVAIRNANIKLIESAGDLVDPIGPCRINGSFDCLSDDTHVRNLLAEVKQRTPMDFGELSRAVTVQAPAVHSGEMPPPRSPRMP